MEPPSKRQRTSRVESRNIYVQDQRWKRHHTDHSGRDHPNTALSTRADQDLWKDSPSAHKMRHGARSKGSREAPNEPRQLDVDVNVDTVVVDVQLNVEVDSEGATLAVVLPSVPAVPQFPSDFHVPSVPAMPSVAPVSIPLPPAYPFTTLEQALPSPAPTAEGSSAPSNDVTGVNFTSELTSSVESSSTPTPSPSRSAQPSNRSSSTISNSEKTTSAPSTAVSTSLPESSATAGQSSFTSTYPSNNATWAASSNAGGFQGGATGIGGAPGGVATAGPDSDPSATAHENNDGPSTPRVVGGVVGGLAGFILILALALAILRRIKQKRRGGALQLGDNDTIDDESLTMTQRSTNNNNGNKFIPPVAAALLNRFSGVSKETDVSDATNERSFQRVSGRKLPSAFSPGMSMEEARDLQNMSTTSLSRDPQNPFSDTAAIGGTGPTSHGGLPPALEKESMMPSPARTPVVHQTPSHGFTAVGGPGAHISGASTLSPPQSPRLPRTLGRSHPSFDGSRGSRFTEDV